MSHRHLSGRMACGLSKWDTEKANRLFIHVLIWWLFLSLLSHFHFKCRRTSFGLCQNTPRGDRKEAVTAPVDREGCFSLALALAVNSLEMLHEYEQSWEKGFILPILFSFWECWEWIRACAVSGGGRSCVMEDEREPGRRKRKIVNTALFAWV